MGSSEGHSLRHKVTKAWYDGNSWISESSDGRTTASTFVVSAVASSHKKYLPPWAGIERYDGPICHSASYPDTGLEVTGKRVAVIENGASAVQIIQSLVKQDCQLTALIRQPAVNLPVGQNDLTHDAQKATRGFTAALHGQSKRTGSGFPYRTVPGSFHDATSGMRGAVWDEPFYRGGFPYFISNNPEWTYDPKVNAEVYECWRKRTVVRVKDPVKRQIVCPEIQPDYLGTKRSNLEQDSYEFKDRPNVELQNIDSGPNNLPCACFVMNPQTAP